MIKIGTLKKLLELFVEKRRGSCGRYTKFHYIDGLYGATDGCAMIVIPHKNIESIEVDEKPLQLKSVIPRIENTSITITLGDLKAAVEGADYIDHIEYTYISTDCEECSGSGEVTYEYGCDKDGDTYYKECDCPMCDGSGCVETEVKTPNGTIRNPFYKIKMGKYFFALKYVQNLIEAMELLNIDGCSLIFENDGGASLFILKDDIKVVIMPMANKID